MKSRRARREEPHDRLSVLEKVSAGYKIHFTGWSYGASFFSLFPRLAFLSHHAVVHPMESSRKLPSSVLSKTMLKPCRESFSNLRDVNAVACIYVHREHVQDHSIQSAIYLFAKAAINIVFPDMGERERKRNRGNEIEIHNRIIIMLDDCSWCTFHCQRIFVL